jgi:hypothetical protein
MRGNQLNTVLSRPFIEWAVILGFIPDQPFRSAIDQRYRENRCIVYFLLFPLSWMVTGSGM